MTAQAAEGTARRGITRREALRCVAACAGIAAAGAALQGCSRGGAPTPVEEVRVPLAEVPDGGRVVIEAAGGPIAIRRDGDAVSALSLRCTHWGCNVAWNEAEQVYDCPCHDGRYTADGRVIAGPPPRPLRAVRVRIDGAVIVVLPRDGAGA